MSEMIERIARWYMPAAWEHETKWALEWRKKSLSRAREVLALMREPTVPMSDAGLRAGSWSERGGGPGYEDGPNEVWQAMIDKALE